MVMVDSSLLNDANGGASAAVAGNLFQSGIVLGKKLYLKQSEDVEYCRYLYLCAALAISPCTIL